MDRLSRVELGHSRERPGFSGAEALRFGDGAERSYSPDDAEGRRKCDVSYGSLHSISATGSGQSGFSRADEGAGGAAKERPGHHGCELRAGSARVGGCGFFARVKAT